MFYIKNEDNSFTNSKIVVTTRAKVKILKFFFNKIFFKIPKKKKKLLEFDVTKTRNYLNQNPILAHNFYQYIACIQANDWLELSNSFVLAKRNTLTQQKDSMKDEDILDSLTLEQVAANFYSMFELQEPILFRTLFFLKLIIIFFKIISFSTNFFFILCL